MFNLIELAILWPYFDIDDYTKDNYDKKTKAQVLQDALISVCKLCNLSLQFMNNICKKYKQKRTILLIIFTMKKPKHKVIQTIYTNILYKTL